jgi:hypothetical protein
MQQRYTSANSLPATPPVHLSIVQQEPGHSHFQQLFQNLMPATPVPFGCFQNQ